MLRPLVIGPAEKEKIAAVVAYAEAHRIDIDAVRRIMTGDGPFPGMIPDHCVMIPAGFGVCFSIEQQPEPLGWCRHISVGIHRSEVLPDLPYGGAEHCPHPLSVQVIMAEFGMKGMREDCISYIEGEGTAVVAINVIEKIDPMAGG
jgi:hypothetical protein